MNGIETDENFDIEALWDGEDLNWADYYYFFKGDEAVKFWVVEAFETFTGKSC